MTTKVLCATATCVRDSPVLSASIWFDPPNRCLSNTSCSHIQIHSDAPFCRQFFELKEDLRALRYFATLREPKIEYPGISKAVRAKAQSRKVPQSTQRGQIKWLNNPSRSFGSNQVDF